jgi:hypothetical protein
MLELLNVQLLVFTWHRPFKFFEIEVATFAHHAGRMRQSLQSDGYNTVHCHLVVSRPVSI